MEGVQRKSGTAGVTGILGSTSGAVGEREVAENLPKALGRGGEEPGANAACQGSVLGEPRA